MVEDFPFLQIIFYFLFEGEIGQILKFYCLGKIIFSRGLMARLTDKVGEMLQVICSIHIMKKLTNSI